METSFEGGQSHKERKRRRTRSLRACHCPPFDGELGKAQHERNVIVPVLAPKEQWNPVQGQIVFERRPGLSGRLLICPVWATEFSNTHGL